MSYSLFFDNGKGRKGKNCNIAEQFQRELPKTWNLRLMMRITLV